MRAGVLRVLTFRRYSTARSGLKNAARIARSISARGNPMLSMFWMAASRWAPRARADGSLKLLLSVVVPAPGAGEGVAGASDVGLEAGAGAAGGAGV